ncbi:MAG TPA: hypothetical protein VF228_20765 [Iamia sp.]
MSAALLRSDATALAAVAALLGPAPTEGGTAAGSRARAYAVLPRRSRPRYLVPVDGRHARGAHIRPGAGAGQAATRLALRAALRSGIGRLLPDRLMVDDGAAGTPGLRRHLAELLGRDDIDVAIALGAPRPNRKPVVQAIGADGATVAWIKIGVDVHTDELVAHEIEAIQAVAGRDPSVVTPPLLASGTWQGHPLLALGHIEMQESADVLDLPPAAIRAIAGATHTEDVVGSPWWRALETAPDGDGAVATLLEALAPDVAGRRWAFGRWHGDLAPWNATWQDDRLLAWDWERSHTPVPLGLDLFHNRVQVAVVRDGVPVPDALRAAAAAETDTLVALGYAPDDAPLLARAYAVTLRSRYASDALHGPLGPCAPIAAGIDSDPTLGREAVS